MSIDPTTRAACQDLLYRYQWLVDHKDLEGLAGIVTDDVELTRKGSTSTGSEHFLNLYRAFAASDVEIANHMATNVLFTELDAGRIRVDSSFLALTTHGTGEARMIWGRYIDEMVEQDGRMLLAAKEIKVSRTVVLGTEMTFDPTADSFGKS